MERSGKLELTWTNKYLRVLADESGGYTRVPPSDYRVSEVRLLHDVETVGDTCDDRSRAKDNLLRRLGARRNFVAVERRHALGRRAKSRPRACHRRCPRQRARR